MGKKLLEQPLKINAKKLSKANKMECADELQAFFMCMARNRFDIDTHCDKERNALSACASAAAKKTKVRNTTNYHLQRLSRSLKR